jgi:hypothetical protein
LLPLLLGWMSITVADSHPHPANLNRRLVDLFNWPAVFAYWSLTAGFPRLAYPTLPSTFQWRTHVQPHTTWPESFRRRPQSILDTECLSHIPIVL